MFPKSLCLSGGGINGFVHIGVLAKLHEEKLLQKIDTIVSTSVGSIIGLFTCIGITPDEMFHNGKYLQTKFLKGTSDISQFLDTFGFDSGEFLIAHLVDILINYNVSPLITFEQLYTIFKKKLIVTGTNILTHSAEYFSIDTVPRMQILQAIRISISIPFIFSAVKWNNGVYVDGGIIDNYPLDYCIQDYLKKNKKENQKENNINLIGNIIGCNVDNWCPISPIQNLEDYIYNILGSITKKEKLKNILHPCTINIKIHKISSIEFNISDEIKKDMRDVGYHQCEEYLNKSRQTFNRRQSI